MHTETNLLMPVQWAGLTRRNPFIVASGPTNKTVPELIEAKQHGREAVSTKPIIDPAPYINRKPRYRWMTEQQENYYNCEIWLCHILKLHRRSFHMKDMPR